MINQSACRCCNYKPIQTSRTRFNFQPFLLKLTSTYHNSVSFPGLGSVQDSTNQAREENITTRQHQHGFVDKLINNEVLINTVRGCLNANA